MPPSVNANHALRTPDSGGNNDRAKDESLGSKLLSTMKNYAGAARSTVYTLLGAAAFGGAMAKLGSMPTADEPRGPNGIKLSILNRDLDHDVVYQTGVRLVKEQIQRKYDQYFGTADDPMDVDTTLAALPNVVNVEPDDVRTLIQKRNQPGATLNLQSFEAVAIKGYKDAYFTLCQTNGIPTDPRIAETLVYGARMEELLDAQHREHLVDMDTQNFIQTYRILVLGWHHSQRSSPAIAEIPSPTEPFPASPTIAKIGKKLPSNAPSHETGNLHKF